VRQALQSRSSGGGEGGEDGVGGGGGGDAAGVFVFYRGVVPFLILGLTEDEGVRDKFGPSIFFLRITVFRGGDDEWVQILSKVTIQILKSQCTVAFRVGTDFFFLFFSKVSMQWLLY
jgi:hypothetical protein